MPHPPYFASLEAEGAGIEDRARVVEAGDALIIAVADGAGGVGGSEHAAEAVVRGLDRLVELGLPLDSEATWAAYLSEVDRAIHRAGAWGLTTAVVLAATDRWICGASVGDSEAWLTTPDAFEELTAGQARKPFLGSGSARPTPFRRDHPRGTLVVGTDGLFKYAPAWRACEVARAHPPELACRLLIDLVRMPNGRLQDDIGVVVCHLGPGSPGPLAAAPDLL